MNLEVHSSQSLQMKEQPATALVLTFPFETKTKNPDKHAQTNELGDNEWVLL